jgi:hypothetical protein
MELLDKGELNEDWQIALEIEIQHSRSGRGSHKPENEIQKPSSGRGSYQPENEIQYPRRGRGS